MAKSSKVEDYWRENNIESLFKELTHILVQRMPSDPALAIVQHLQKKFPKSFKTSTDNNSNIGVVPKMMVTNLQSLTSPRSDVNIESTSDLLMQRRSSNQSQVSGIAMIPTTGSAFTDLFKQDTSSSRQAPELSLKNLVFANRLSQQVVKMGKDIRSDRDIIDEEVIKPIKTKSTANMSMNSMTEDPQGAQTYDELSVPQLIKYKQQIQTENNRRVHREKLADLAKTQREKEQSSQSDVATKPDEIEQQQNFGGDQIVSRVVSETNNTKLSYKPIVKSKEEEEILDDENVFQQRKTRPRERQRNKLLTSHSPHIGKRYIPDLRLSMRKGDENAIPIMQFGICKVCGNEINNEENRPIVDSQRGSATQTARIFEREPSARSVETASGVVDDWFESASDVSDSRQLSTWLADNPTPLPTGSDTFRRNLFQPIKDNTTDAVERPPLIPPDGQTKTQRLSTSRMSESGIFARSPEPKIRRSSSSRSVPSPVSKKQQIDTSEQVTKTVSSSRSIPPSTLTASNNNRSMPGWSVREHSPDDSDDN